MKKKTSVSKIATRNNAKKAVNKANEASAFLLANKPLLIAAGGSVVAYFLYKRLKQSADAVTEVFQDVANDHIEADLHINTGKLSIDKEQAKILAKSLLDAFNNTAFGLPATDEAKVQQVFDKLQTGDDFRLVYKIFGRRKRMGGKTPTVWLDKKLADDYDLIYWLKAEFQRRGIGNYITKLNNEYKAQTCPFKQKK
ncbi:hypothetical protein MK851_15135 [Tenacibaculum sp. 1B UA]|uniref:hypothetical protein n=1 Tax=Tenacibaculum sp. 1B UA TaxID=2922252 RepID=UPI002A23C7F6|nr:hypothetical protein [Tenacibaculum sp. 1B UA]MDX8554948.1 hypothetical protein [Tenacibaculum sp. 1B UA]